MILQRIGVDEYKYCTFKICKAFLLQNNIILSSQNPKNVVPFLKQECNKYSIVSSLTQIRISYCILSVVLLYLQLYKLYMQLHVKFWSPSTTSRNEREVHSSWEWMQYVISHREWLLKMCCTMHRETILWCRKIIIETLKLCKNSMNSLVYNKHAT